MSDNPSVDFDQLSPDELRARLRDAEETLRAIRHGEVDALLINQGDGQRVDTLRGADAPYRALVEQMQEGAVTVNLTGDIVYANQSFAGLVGADLEHVIGSRMNEFIEVSDRKGLERLLRAGMGVIRTRLQTREKKELEAHISVSHVTLDDVEHRTLIVSDVSALTKVQKENRSKDEFLAMLAHELRNPLAPIRTGLQVLRLAPGEEAAERAREMMDRQLSQMIRLIDDLLDVSRVSRGKIELKKEAIDLKTVIGIAIETSLPVIEAGHHELIIHLTEKPLPIEADPTRMAQVFSNLLNNSAKYTPEGGRIELRAERQGDHAEISVEDNGVGIPKDMVPEVFEMFAQVGRNLDRAQGGLGIGLTLVRRLTEMHGGSVRAHSGGMGKGCIFTVSLPLSPEIIVAAPAQPRRTFTRESPKRQMRVLVVDDSLDGAEMLSMLVSMHGHAAEIAHSGPEALQKIASCAADIVFLDIGLPELNGYAVARRLRAQEKELGRSPTLLVALTGWGSEEDKKRSIEAGFDLHLTKPVDARTVESLLRRVGSVSEAQPRGNSSEMGAQSF
jgi:PAS domain S-box-containing protein